MRRRLWELCALFCGAILTTTTSHAFMLAPFVHDKADGKGEVSAPHEQQIDRSLSPVVVVPASSTQKQKQHQDHAAPPSFIQIEAKVEQHQGFPSCKSDCRKCEQLVKELTTAKNGEKCAQCSTCMKSGAARSHGPPACGQECGKCGTSGERLLASCQPCHDCKVAGRPVVVAELEK
ncbi:unnamed protein product [Amoebophrya sp. A120]|nr:unnamed protein product [Amoebophrya sp. A120]|eukprot:GSA120T00017167001.1